MEQNSVKNLHNTIKRLEAERKAADRLDYERCQQILKEARDSQSDALFGMGYYFLAEYYLGQVDYEQTMYCLTECCRFFQQAQMYEYLARSYNMMGAVADRENNALLAMGYYYSCLQYAEKHGYTYAQAMSEFNIARSMTRMKQLREAIGFYTLAERDFVRSEQSFYKDKNLVRTMMHCGLCCLQVGELERALELWGRIRTVMREGKELYFPILSLLALEAGLEAAQGRWGRADALLRSWLEALHSREALKEASEGLVAVLILLEKMQRTEMMEQLFTQLDQIGLEDEPSIRMDIYPYRSAFLLRQQRLEEYISITKQYFQLYEQYQENSRHVTMRMIELQDKLREIEQERLHIQADNDRLQSIALYDTLTNLPNRTYLNEYMTEHFDKAQAEQTLFAVELLDIDFFKRYNDTYGHLEGDRCLEAVAEILHSVQNTQIFVARYGGDEFALIYEHMKPEEVLAVMKSIQERIQSMVLPGAAAGQRGITVSQGALCRIPHVLNRQWDYSKAADRALYLAKERGRNQCVLWDTFQGGEPYPEDCADALDRVTKE